MQWVRIKKATSVIMNYNNYCCVNDRVMFLIFGLQRAVVEFLVMHNFADLEIISELVFPYNVKAICMDQCNLLVNPITISSRTKTMPYCKCGKYCMYNVEK